MEFELIKSGLEAYMEENYKTAVDQFSKALEKDTNNVEALIYRAASYNKLGNFSAGLDDLNRAECDNKNEQHSYEIFYNRAKLLINLNNFKSASEDLNKAKSLNGLSDERKTNVEKLIKLIS